MLDYAEFIERVEHLPVNELNRFSERANAIVTDAQAGRIAHALAYLDRLVGDFTRCRPIIALKVNLSLGA